MTHGIPGEEFFTSFAIKISRKWNILWKWLHYNDWTLYFIPYSREQCSAALCGHLKVKGTLSYILHTLAKPLKYSNHHQ